MLKLPNKDIKRFWSKVKKTRGCWEWIGTLDSSNYGQMSVNGKLILAHRISYKLFYEKLLNKLCVLHKCDNSKCVNPRDRKSVV